jgi:hypothetical protein
MTVNAIFVTNLAKALELPVCVELESIKVGHAVLAPRMSSFCLKL